MFDIMWLTNPNAYRNWISDKILRTTGVWGTQLMLPALFMNSRFAGYNSEQPIAAHNE